MNLLRTKALTKLYAPDTGAQNINLELNRGEIVGFIGPNGAGKSTTMEMIMHLIHKDSGKVFLFDKEIDNRDELVRVMDKVGYLPAEGGIQTFLTSRDYLKYCAGFYEKIDLNKINAFAEEIKLDLNKKISQLSSGNKKKVSFISSIINDPEILILDEPTSSLDPLVQNQLLSEVKRVRDKGGAVLLSSHTLSEVQSVCDRIYLIKDSRIILSERTEVILESAQKRIKVNRPSKLLKGKLSLSKAVHDLSIFDDHLEFYSRDIKPIIDMLTEEGHYDFLVEQPTLEKMFMEYYK